MSFQVPVDSRHVLVPVPLEDRGTGARLAGALPVSDVAGAMVIFFAPDGAFTQEFHPLRVVPDPEGPYAGEEWELRSGDAGGGWHAYYLGIPDAVFAAGAGHASLSVEIVGSSLLGGALQYSGGVDVAVGGRLEPDPAEAFLDLRDRLFPALLTPDFVASNIHATLDFRGRAHRLVLADLRVAPGLPLPPSFDRHFKPQDWMGAVVEPREGGDGAAFHTVSGGCFRTREGKLTHWFGRLRASEDKDFRLAAGEKILSLGSVGEGAWAFWLQPHPVAGEVEVGPGAGLCIRHPFLFRVWEGSESGAFAERAAADPDRDLDAAAGLLAEAARLHLRHPGAGAKVAGGARHMPADFRAAAEALYSRYGRVWGRLEAAFAPQGEGGEHPWKRALEARWAPVRARGPAQGNRRP